MPETSVEEFAWPKGSWELLKRIIRAWYAAGNGGDEFTQRKVAQLAKIQPSRVSNNKAFLQSVGILEVQGVALTEAGRNFGLGLFKENVRIQKQALQKIARQCTLLKHLLDVIRGRGLVDKDEFEAELTLMTKQGSTTAGFTIGVNVIQDILRESGLIEVSGNTLRPTQDESEEEKKSLLKDTPSSVAEKPAGPGLRRIPIPVSASSVWYVELDENPGEGEIEKFIEMQKLIFTKK
jgi:hypothetical protein